MNLFRNRIPDTIPEPSRMPIADIPFELFVIYERLFNRSRRLYVIVQTLGGQYPLADLPTIDASDDLCGRIYYEISNIRHMLEEVDGHLVRMERLCGIPTDEVPVAPEIPGARGSDEPLENGIPGASQPPPLAI